MLQQYFRMIRNFRDSETERIFDENFSNQFPRQIQGRAKTCLDRIHAANSPDELFAFRSMRLKKLSGNLKGQFSVRVNKQYRICFGWIERYAVNVELTDYH